MSNDNEPIIDALLEELLGDVQPPDLTARILSRHESESSGTVDASMRKSPPFKPSQARSVSRKTIASSRAGRESKKQDRRFASRFWASAVVVLISASIFAIWATDYVADQYAANHQIETIHQPPIDDFAVRVPADAGSGVAVEPASSPTEDQTTANAALADQEIGTKNSQPIAPPQFVRTIPLARPASDSVVIDYVNRQLKNKWEEESIRPLPAVADDEWLARAEVFLLGREQPSIRGRKRFDREEMVDRMLASDEFAEHWSEKLATIMLGNTQRKDVHYDQLNAYMAEALKAGKAFDEIAYELITAVGSNQADAPDYNPATNFLLAYQPRDQKSERRRENRIAAEKICQIFLGKQLQCAECHDSKGLQQEDYYEMVAFLTQMRAATSGPNHARLFNGDFAGSQGDSLADAELFFNRSDETGAVAYPQFLDGHAVQTNSGRIAEIDRRTELAKLVVSSDEFAAAVINRFWRQLFGSGFTSPVDDMGSHNEASHPELLARLATEFRNRQFDVRAALKWMALSSAFDRQQRRQIPIRRDEFSSFAIRTRTFENISNPLMQLARSRETGGDLNGVIAQLGPVKNQHKKVNKVELTLHRDQDKIREKLLDEKQGGLIWKLANSSLDDQQKVDHLFLAILGRKPKPGELKNAVRNLQHGSQLLALQDVAWVLFRSEEFETQH